MRQVADQRIDWRNACTPIDDAFGDEAARIHAKTKKDRRPARPLVELVAGEVAPAHDWAR